MGIKKILVLILSVFAFHSCRVDVEYIYYDFILENKTRHTIMVEWETNTECETSFELTWGAIKQIGIRRYPPVKISSATLTFEDGKVLKYSSEDQGRSLCNPQCYDCSDGNRVYTYSFTITDEDYALAVMPSEE